MNAAILRDSPNFLEFIERVKVKRDNELDRIRTVTPEQLAQARDRYNAFDEVVNLLDQAEAEEAAFSAQGEDDEE
jgi:hypothetical protein